MTDTKYRRHTSTPATVTHVTALKTGDATICPTRCWSCMTDQCPSGWHPWADPEDIEHAAANGQPDPSGQSCGCRCVELPVPYDDLDDEEPQHECNCPDCPTNPAGEI